MRSKRSAEARKPYMPEHDEVTIRDTDTYRLVADLDADRRAKVGAALKVEPKAEAIAMKLLEPGHLEEVWTSADPIEKVLLRAASASTRTIGKGTLTRVALDRRHSPVEIEQRLTRLEKAGILLWRDVGFSPGYAVAPEVAARIRAAASADMIGPAVAAKPGIAADHAGAFLDDLVTTLAFLKRSAYRITRGGAVHAADLKRLGARLIYPESEAGPGGDAAGYPSAPVPANGSATPAAQTEPFPTRLGLALDLVRRLLLVRFDPDDIKVDDRRVRQWLDRPADDVRRDLVKAASREPWRWQRELAAVSEFLSEREANQWVFIEDVARALEYHPDFLGCRPDQLRARVQSGATYLCWLGVAAVSPEEIHPDAIALTPMGKRLLSDEATAASPEKAFAEASKPEEKLTVLPTFQVIFPTTAPLVVRYALEVFADAEPGATGPVRSFKLEKRTLLQALKGGLPLAEIQRFLATHALEMPDNVRISIEEWARAYGEYYFMNPTLLVCRDAVAAAAAKADPKIAERVLGQLTPEILILSEGSVEPVRASLEGNGSMPRAGLEEIPPPAGDKPLDPAARAAAISRFLLKRASDRNMVESTEEFDTLRKPADAPPAKPSLTETIDSIAAEDEPAPSDSPNEDRRQAKLCAITGCGRPHAARGLCTLHYQAARRGKLNFPTL